MKKAIVFDLDGTLLNTLEDLADSTNYALRLCCFPERTLEEIRCFVGNGIRKLIERAVPENAPKDKTDECFTAFCEHYKQNMENKTAEYDGISEMLSALYDAGYKMAIVTNKADFAAQVLCSKLFGKYVKTVVGSVETRPNKPAPDGVYFALEKMGVSKEEAVFVGDSEVDILTAKNADIDAVGVLWGFRDLADLEAVGVKMTVKTIKELENLLLSLKN
ncbi:MAG: HAD family hydrolase [Candidatus Fimenecus sp.]